MNGRLVAVLGVIGSAAVYKAAVEPWWKGWGVDEADAARSLPGDDIVASPSRADTRAIDVAAPPSSIWPWLVQMGFGRAGWYSYDTVDMSGSSSDRVLPEWQRLAVGDILPTHPGGGFEVRVLEPERALVLYSDTDIVRDQAAAAREAGALTGPANIRASGAFLSGSQPSAFRVSWAFVLDPVGEHRTRLIERVRVAYEGDSAPWTALTLPLLGFGVFVMMRRQMLGIRERAERMATPGGLPADAVRTDAPEESEQRELAVSPRGPTELVLAAPS